jgi:DNA ligase-1
MARRDLLLLADKFHSDKHDPVGMLMSEKLDGSRCWWDGGVTRGQPTTSVPWANIYDKDGVSFKKKIKPVATGLWTRYGNPMMAPDWFLDALPRGVSLDGEVYAGHGKFQYVQKAVRKDVPIDSEWKGLSYNAFGCPTYAQVLQDGLIKLSGNVTYIREINQTICLEYVAKRYNKACGDPVVICDQSLRDAESLPFLRELAEIEAICNINNSPLCVPVPHTICESTEQVLRLAKEVDEAGGEGMMLRDPESIWFPKRRNFILKVKPRHDSEASIIGFFAGREGKTGQFLGKLGGLIVRWHGDPTATCGMLKLGIDFELGTGLTHADRELELGDRMFAKDHPGKPMPDCRRTPTFKLGDRVTFAYRELSDGGVPKEASYLRIRKED